MISGVTMRINIDEYLMNALKEDITQGHLWIRSI